MNTTILLENIELNGNHGVNPLEQKTGTRFIVHVDIALTLPNKKLNLAETIDYAAVYALLKEEFSHTEQLIENLSLRIIHKIFTTFIQSTHITLTIIKKDAPIMGFKGQVGVRNSIKREDFFNKIHFS